MAERLFANMLLHSDTLEAFEGRVEVAEAQHEADMLYEIVCPQCDGVGSHWWGKDTQGPCLLCGGRLFSASHDYREGTGRVTLDSLVAADRARQARST